MTKLIKKKNFVLEILICRVAYLPKYWKLKSLCQWVLEIQPAVITTFALSDLMALSDDLSLRSNTACR